MTDQALLTALLARTPPAPRMDDDPQWSAMDLDAVKRIQEDRWLSENEAE